MVNLDQLGASVLYNSGCLMKTVLPGLTIPSRSAAKVKITDTLPMWKAVARSVSHLFRLAK